METLVQQGLLSLDKPRGISSAAVVARVKRRLGAAKAGHCGTLDPAAEGLLVIGLGRATRVLPYVAAQRKRYEACVRLGVRTATADCEGEWLARRPYRVPEARRLRRLFDDFCGETMQAAPQYSALKHHGQRLYQLARAGRATPLKRRRICIYSLCLRHLHGDGFCFDVECSQGTYVRSLAEDMGARLGSVAYLSRLRRTAIGAFSLARALPLAALDTCDDEALARCIGAPDEGLSELPVIVLDDERSERFCLGQEVAGTEAEPAGGVCRVYGETRRFLGIAVQDGARLRPRRIFAR